jgi:hypothetical protein
MADQIATSETGIGELWGDVPEESASKVTLKALLPGNFSGFSGG